MAQAAKQKKLKALFDASVAKGGLPEFRTNWEQSIGVVADEDTGAMVFNPEKREVDYKDFHIGACMEALIGSRWKKTFEQHWQRASALRFEGVGSAVMPGELSYVSAAIDVIAGLANARALERPSAPEFIWDRFCTVTEIEGEGGFDIIVRSDGGQPAQDLAPGEVLPTVKLKASRVHRNRTLNQGLRTKINKYTVLDDLTGTLYEAVDENANMVLNERERKVADCVLGVSAGTTLATGKDVGVPGLAMPMIRDGLTFFPYQKGIWGANAGATIASPENGRLIQNFANANETDGQGLTDYTFLIRALAILHANRDPFTGLPVKVPLDGMQILVAPRSRPQLDVLLQARNLWQIANGGFNTSGGTATTSDYNFVKEKNLQIAESQVWFNRLVDVGAMKVAANGTVTQQTLTNAAADSYNTAGSIASAVYLGHFKQAVKYAQRQPYSVVQVPLSSVEYAEETVMIQDVRERGQAYWVNPGLVWRAWA